MLIAFASSDGLTIDSHFASAPSFELYKFGSEGQKISHTSHAAEITDSNDKVDTKRYSSFESPRRNNDR